jgi:hypothetical protein
MERTMNRSVPLAFLSLPYEVQRAVETLLNYGVPEKELWRLVFRPPLFRRKPGPKPKPRLSNQESEPKKKWTEPRYRTLLKLYEIGAAILKERQERVTDSRALIQAFSKQFREEKLTSREIRIWAKADAKRLSEARKVVRK